MMDLKRYWRELNSSNSIYLFKYSRCESALGNKLYIKAFEYLKANRNNEPQLIREHLISRT
jgi:hypothetical protein